jgi:hypothetical protein
MRAWTCPACPEAGGGFTASRCGLQLHTGCPLRVMTMGAAARPMTRTLTATSPPSAKASLTTPKLGAASPRANAWAARPTSPSAKAPAARVGPRASRSGRFGPFLAGGGPRDAGEMETRALNPLRGIGAALARRNRPNGPNQPTAMRVHVVAPPCAARTPRPWPTTTSTRAAAARNHSRCGSRDRSAGIA